MSETRGLYGGSVYRPGIESTGKEQITQKNEEKWSSRLGSLAYEEDKDGFKWECTAIRNARVKKSGIITTKDQGVRTRHDRNFLLKEKCGRQGPHGKNKGRMN